MMLLSADEHLLAEITFTLGRPSSNLEYRFWADRGPRIEIERVSLESQ
jgi:hypothetical protein